MMLERFWLSVCLFLVCLPLASQVADGPYISWEDFVADYFEEKLESENEEGKENLEEEMEELEILVAKPLQINLVSKNQLLNLPFLDESQVDSLLSYRDKKRGFRSLGELQYVKYLDYRLRNYLSLFLRCDSVFRPAHRQSAGDNGLKSLSRLLTQGKQLLQSHLDIPLYKRAGFTEAQPDKNNYYMGNPLHHCIRYRYTYHREAIYGINLEKDAGEPVGKQGFYPYDYLSAYCYLRPKHEKWSVVVGDYELKGARGLLFGKQLYSQREISGGIQRFKPLDFRPHTGMDEYYYLRGMAASYRWNAWQVMAFLSYRQLDARTTEEGDTVRTILSTGLHRTLSEIERRREVGAFTYGTHFGVSRTRYGLFFDIYGLHFDRLVYPVDRPYNISYFRGRNGGCASLSYYFNQNRWQLQGELASDHHGHWAMEHTWRARLGTQWQTQVQYRHFSSRFTSFYGDALRQGSRVANEEGMLFSALYRPMGHTEWSGYVDLYRFLRPTYLSALSGALGAAFTLQCQIHFSQSQRMGLRYRFKTRQQTISGQELLEYRSLHQLRASWTHSAVWGEIHLQADASYAVRQTGKQSKGWMISQRTSWPVSSTIQFKAFTSLFFSDDYESALYAYEPRLFQVAAIPSFSNHGMRAVLMSQCRLFRTLTFGLRYSVTHYFNRSSISSGAELIPSSWKNDLSMQLLWTI